jgi:putative ABC transport system permease protein
MDITRNSRPAAWLETTLQDLRFAVRTLAKSPAFTGTALLVLTLGIGASVAIFSVVNAVLLRPLKAPHADRLVRFLGDYGTTTDDYFTSPRYVSARGMTDVFEDVAAHRLELMNLTGDGQPERIPVARVTASFFRLFGASMTRGRGFTTEEDAPGGIHVVVLSHEFWTRRFAADPSTVGKTITLAGGSYTVVGILAPGFDTEQFDPLPEAWIPFQIDLAAPRQGDYCVLTGRLKPGVSLVQAREALAAADAERRRNDPKATATAKTTVELLRSAMAGDVRPSLWLLSGAVSLVLLIACSNIASLLLVRAGQRRREFAIRASLGASRLRVARQFVTESIVVSLAGGSLGLLLGIAGIRAILSRYAGSSLAAAGYPVHLPRIGASASGITVDWRVAAFALIVSVLTGILFGLVPSIAASLHTDLNERFRRSRKRGVFIVAEVAFALVLLIGAFLLIRTYIALRSVNPGFDERHVLVTQMAVNGSRFEKAAELDQLVQRATEHLRAVPGIVDAGAGCCIPLETTWQMPLIVQGRPLTGWFHAFAGYTFVSPGYFDSLKIPLLRGRGFTEHDRAGAPPVVIVNQALVRQLWPSTDPLQDRVLVGKGMGPLYDHDSVRQIVGVVGDIRDRGLNNPPRPAIYIPIAQLPDQVAAATLQVLPIAWFIRLPIQWRALDSVIRRELEQASDGLPATAMLSMDQVAAQSAARQQFQMLLMSVFGGAALLLAAVGIYGLMAYSVQQRMNEFGIRLALGASPAALRIAVTWQAARLALAGIGIGLGAAFGLSRLIESFLHGVKARDPLVFATVPLALIAAALVAASRPAARAARIDPVVALRTD